MAIKYTIQGLLIYASMAGYLIAFVMMMLRQRKAGHILFLAGFLVGCTAFAYRWAHVGHIPLQNLFEVFLCLGVLMCPISIFCNRVLRIGGVAADMLIGVIVLFPAGFVFSAEPQQLPPALQTWLFGPHVLVYMLSYILMTKAAVQAFLQLANKPLVLYILGVIFFIVFKVALVVALGVKIGLIVGVGVVLVLIRVLLVLIRVLFIKKQPPGDLLEPEPATYRMICAGFPLLTLGLVLGSIWGQNAWGDWWGWDPKELWSLASWLVYVGYFHFRYMFGKRFPLINSLWAIAGLIAIVITLLWVNLSRLFPGLHNYAM